MSVRRQLLRAVAAAAPMIVAPWMARSGWARGASANGSTGLPRSPEVMGFALGMPLDTAVRQAQGIAPSGSVTLPPVRRDPFIIVEIEAPAALTPPSADASEGRKDGNFYLLLNSAPRALKSQPSRSSHVDFITLVADRDQRRLVRVVFEPALVHWQNGFDASSRTAGQLVDALRTRYSVDARLMPPARAEGREFRSTREARDGDLREREPNGRERPPKAEPRASGWELRVHADRKSIVLTDLIRLPDEHASRLRLD